MAEEAKLVQIVTLFTLSLSLSLSFVLMSLFDTSVSDPFFCLNLIFLYTSPFLVSQPSIPT